MGLFDWLDTKPKMPTLDQAYKQQCLLNKTAAENGDPVAQFDFGSACLSGEHVSKDEALGIYWLKKSAHQGNFDAQVTLGKAFALGNFGLTNNPESAIELLLAAVDQSHDGADRVRIVKIKSAARLLGYLYAKNLGVEKHSQKVKKLLLIDNESIPSLYYLGCIYLNDSNQDASALSKAATCFAKMIEADFRNIEELSRGLNGRVEASYKDEAGDPIELEGCLKLLLDAGKNGNSDAQFSLGLIFLSGWRGFDVDIETATDLISSSANLGHPTAIALMNRKNQSIT